MRVTDITGFAVGNFLRRKTRSALTVLGVLIGTASVVIMLSIGIGVNVGHEKNVSQWGNLREITVYQGWSGEDSPRLTMSTIQEIRKLKGIAAVTPRQYFSFPVMNGRKYAYPSIIGIFPEEMAALGLETTMGRLLDSSDSGTLNAVMSYNVPFYFFDPNSMQWWVEVTYGQELPFNPMETTLKFTFDYSYGQGPQSIDKPRPKIYTLEVVGVLKQKEIDYETLIYMDVNELLRLRKLYEESQSGGESYYNSDVIIKRSASDIAIIGGKESNGGDTGGEDETAFDNLMVYAKNTDSVEEIERQLREMGFETYSNMSTLLQMREQSKMLTTMLGMIGIVAFFVAAISITNTMIMSIYERTREIGIMKVMGCKLSDIRAMFLFEAGIIGLVGGVIGSSSSYGLSALINHLGKGKGGILGIDYGVETDISIVPLWLNLAALGLAVCVGVVSGLYPAIRATRLSALEAIKNE